MFECGARARDERGRRRIVLLHVAGRGGEIGFDNLADEFEARAKSRNPNNEQPPEGDGERDSETRLDGESIRNLVDPFAPDLDKAEGRKNPFQRPVKDGGAGWTDGVDSLNDLPAGDELAEGDPDVRSTGKNFRRTLYQRYDDASDGLSKYTSTASDFFKPHPTGHAETRVDSGPMVADVNHPGIDPGSAASSLLALGIVGAELLRWSRDKIKREVRDEGHG